jgi:hypothetical protein
MAADPALATKRDILDVALELYRRLDLASAQKIAGHSH